MRKKTKSNNKKTIVNIIKRKIENTIHKYFLNNKTAIQR